MKRILTLMIVALAFVSVGCEPAATKDANKATGAAGSTTTDTTGETKEATGG